MDPYANYDKEFVHTPEQSVPTIQPIYEHELSAPVKKSVSIIKIVLLTCCVLILCIGACITYAYEVFHTAVQPNTTPLMLDIPKGASLQRVTQILADAHVINSPFIFRASMIFGGLESSIKTGEYTFSKPLYMTQVIERLVKGKYEYTPVKLTIHEGEDSTAISMAIAAAFPKLSASTTEVELKKHEGKLFPETYSFAPFATLDEILKTIDVEYAKRIASYTDDIASSTHSEEEILTIASILEKEVPHKDDMRMVAGIIYNRLKKNILLQMDSTLGYITDKASLELTTDDLKIDSPYNSYLYKGLPPTPIGNPGDASIDAALHPVEHSYIFFLSDKDGVNHYAVTYAEHLKNRKKYLGK